MSFRLRCTLEGCGESGGHFLMCGDLPEEYASEAEARDRRRVASGFEIVEVTYGLRWYTRRDEKGVPHDYLTKPYVGVAFTNARKDAMRFDSAEEARAYANPSLLSFRDGPDDVTGLRVVRFTRKVKP